MSPMMPAGRAPMDAPSTSPPKEAIKLMKAANIEKSSFDFCISLRRMYKNLGSK